MIGAFIEWEVKNPQRRRKDKQPPGYIIDGNGCHIWTGTSHPNGYGTVKINEKMVRVHRVRYEREVGPIPVGMELDHYVCNNPGCCNPLHCRPVTHRENCLRGNGVGSVSAAKTHCSNGHELSGHNLLPWPLKKGRRGCRACKGLDQARRRKRNREKLGANA